jgi:hypothetical protein
MQLGGRAADAHTVERAIDKECDQEESRARMCVKLLPLLTGRELHGKPDSQQAEEGRTDDGVESDEEVSLKGSPTVSPMTVASCSGVAFASVDLDNFLGVVPCAVGVGENGPAAEDRDGEQVADKKKGRRKRRLAWRRRRHKMFSMPLAHRAQISTTFLLSATPAAAVFSMNVIFRIDGAVCWWSRLGAGAREPVKLQRRR